MSPQVGKKLNLPKKTSRLILWIGVLVCTTALQSNAMAETAKSETHALGRFWRTFLDRAFDTRARIPKPSLDIEWRARKVGTVQLEEPVLALSMYDLDGDGVSEMFVLTENSVALLRMKDSKIAIESLLPIDEPRSITGPRSSVGQIEFVADRALVRSSRLSKGVMFSLSGKELRKETSISGFPFCGDGKAELVTGRDYFEQITSKSKRFGFTPVPKRFYSSRCVDHIFDSTNRRMHILGLVSTDRVLHIYCDRGGKPCRASPAQNREYRGVGSVFGITDVNRDGSPEVLVSSARPPGDTDSVTVYARKQESVVEVFKAAFKTGIVGISSGDFTGQGRRQVWVGAREPGSEELEVWSLSE